MGIPIIHIRRSHHHLIFVMETPIPVSDLIGILYRPLGTYWPLVKTSCKVYSFEENMIITHLAPTISGDIPIYGNARRNAFETTSLLVAMVMACVD